MLLQEVSVNLYAETRNWRTFFLTDMLTLYRVQKPNVALIYLKKALKFEMETEQALCNVAGTKLNICAILSLMRK